MTELEIKSLIEQALTDAEAEVSGDGYHFLAKVISPRFEAKSRIERQRLVYETLMQSIQNGAIHAITIKTYTPEEWSNHEKL